MVHQKANPQLKLFSLSSNPEIAEKIAKATGLPLGKVSSRQFSDGEIMINIEESVRGDDIYIIQSTSNPVNDHLWELLIMIDACKRASANSVNVVMPYFGYARQDRIAASREPITAKLIANMLVKAGVNRVLTLDLHAVQVQGFFDIPVDNLFTMPLFAEYYNEKGFTGSDVVVVSPKNSGVKRARSLAEYLDAPIAIIDYAQDDSEREEGYIIGEVEGKLQHALGRGGFHIDLLAHTNGGVLKLTVVCNLIDCAHLIHPLRIVGAAQEENLAGEFLPHHLG